jgi:hypothetical protein
VCRAYASDSIWALSIILSAVHIALHDYSYVNRADTSSPNTTCASRRVRSVRPGAHHGSLARRFKATISLNAAIFVSVLLASRLVVPRRLACAARAALDVATATRGQETGVHVFAYIFFAFEVFAGFPVVAFNIKASRS